jgi:hypothetical protein
MAVVFYSKIQSVDTAIAGGWVQTFAQNMSLAHKASAAKLTRENPEWFLTNFLSNVSTAALLMRACMKEFRTQDLIFREAIRNYVISLVGALETFYRDLFVHIYAERPALVSQIVRRIARGRTVRLSHPTLTEVEMASAVISFQRLEDVDIALSPLVTNGTSYFEAITGYKAVCAVPSRHANAVRVSLSPDWKKPLEQLLSDRHRYVHDRNADCDSRPEFMQVAETVVLMLGQLTGLYFLESAGLLRKPEDGLPAFFLIDDLTASDWEAYDPETKKE